MKQRICVCIGLEKLEDSLNAALTAAAQADVIEIRLDLIKDTAVAPFLAQIETPLLFTNRAAWEGGNFGGGEASRIAPLVEAIQGGAAYVDLEILAPEESWDALKKAVAGTATRVISSWHNFEKTPSQEVLLQKLEMMHGSGAHIGKIITMAHTYRDVLCILGLQERAAQLGFPLIAFCMGDAGIISRVATCALGGYMTYCAAEKEAATAPGQVNLADMHTIYRLMGS